MVLTEYPVAFSNIGTRTSRSPESCVLVVVERISVREAGMGVWAARGPAATRSATTERANRRRVMICFLL
jgi:hypothetical protein